MVKKEHKGYKILHSEMYRRGKHSEKYIVLAENEKTGLMATWDYIESLENTETGGYEVISEFYDGHYFENKMRAWMDYHQRLLEKYDMPWEE